MGHDIDSARLSLIDRLGDFILVERDRFKTRHNNLVAVAFSDLRRYRQFLQLIHSRQKEVSRRFLAVHNEFQATLSHATGTLDQRQTNLLEESQNLGLLLRLEVESFYLFAKILLDRIARSIEFYFGSVRKCPLDSHDDLTKRMRQYAGVKGLYGAEALVQRAEALKKDVADFRDYQIVHHKNPRTITGIMWDGAGRTRLSLSQLYPAEGDTQEETRAIDELLKDLDAYLAGVLDFIVSNRGKTALELVSG